jgi:hypothetical protein
VVDRPDAAAGHAHYAGKRAPLAPSPVIKLPVGAVKPAGWIRKVLELQVDGFHGHLTEISDFLKKENNSWLSKDGSGQRGWEEVPYWLKGFIGAAYLLEDDRMIREAHVWVEGALGSQKEDGWFGPDKGRTGAATDLKGRDDLWPNMIVIFYRQTYYERTGDKRVIDLMRKYFKYLAALPEERFFVGNWPPMRGGDQALQHPVALQPHGRGVAPGPGAQDPPQDRALGPRRHQLGQRQHRPGLPRARDLRHGLEGSGAPRGD